jgi:hypothetical protein
MLFYELKSDFSKSIIIRRFFETAVEADVGATCQLFTRN